MNRKRVLIITYYWPPAGGGGVQRWLKHVKYLREFGWEPVIYTPEGGETALRDESLLKEIPEGVEIVKQPIWEPYSFYKKFTGKKKEEKVYSGFISGKKKSFTQTLSVWIRGNFFIPDARKFWIKPSIKFLSAYLKEHPVDAIVSTGPPHSMHLIALGIKEKLNIPWLADFRDPWTNIDFYDQLRLTSWADQEHKRLEKKVLRKADEVVTVTWSWAEDFEKISGRELKVITNGYDPADFENNSQELTKNFSITHIGSMNKDRNPPVLWEALKEIAGEIGSFKQDLQLVLIGPTDYSVLESIKNSGFESNLKKIDLLPHNEVIQYLKRSQVLLLPINNTPNVSGVVPGKLFEYLGAKRPIICIGPHTGDSAKIIREAGAGKVSDFGDTENLKKHILEYYDAYKQGNLEVNSEDIKKYSRQTLAGKIANVLDKISSKSTTVAR